MTATSEKRHVILRVPRIHPNDAVSNDLLMQAGLLKAAGWKVSVVASGAAHGVNLITDEQAKRFSSDPRVICINHFAGFDRRLWSFRRRVKGPFILRYHNVTPPTWFLPYSPRSFLFSLLGRLQAVLFVCFGRCSLLMSASHFSNAELSKYLPKGLKPKDCVVPVCRDFKLFSMNARTPLPFDRPIAALFVGRIVPHKGVHYFPDILKAWSESTLGQSKNLKITIVGKVSKDFEEYQTRILSKANALGVSRMLEFRDAVGTEELREFYKHADIFISPSEHEGFGVPFIEAQAAGLPVLALDRGAASETIGDGGVCLCKDKPFNAQVFVEAISDLFSNPKRREQVVHRGLANVKRFDSERTLKTLTEILESLP